MKEVTKTDFGLEQTRSDLVPSKTHGKSKTRVYRIWQRMKDRCCNQKHTSYHLYGGKGIKVCDLWVNNFEEFYKWSMGNGYSDNLSIDRINSNKGYEPLNCRWATPTEQANNTNRNKYITYNGETKSYSQWAKTLGMNNSTLYDRLYRRGWSVEDAFEKEVKKCI